MKSMYEKLIGTRIKIVYQDGNNIGVSTGEVLGYDKATTSILLFEEKKFIQIYINLRNVHKIEEVASR